MGIGKKTKGTGPLKAYSLKSMFAYIYINTYMCYSTDSKTFLCRGSGPY